MKSFPILVKLERIAYFYRKSRHHDRISSTHQYRSSAAKRPMKMPSSTPRPMATTWAILFNFIWRYYSRHSAICAPTFSTNTRSAATSRPTPPSRRPQPTSSPTPHAFCKKSGGDVHRSRLVPTLRYHSHHGQGRPRETHRPRARARNTTQRREARLCARREVRQLV